METLGALDGFSPALFAMQRSFAAPTFRVGFNKIASSVALHRGKAAVVFEGLIVEEKRRATRRQLMREVHVVTVDDVKLPSAFTLLDISQSGARLKAPDMTGIPREFYLMLRGDLMRWCRVAWRNKTQAGVRFIKEPKADAR